jgi:hypothetical protein
MPFVLRKEAFAKAGPDCHSNFDYQPSLLCSMLYLIQDIAKRNQVGAMKRSWERKGALAWARRRLREISWPILAIFWMVALGIGLNAGVFAVRSQIFPHLPYLHPEQLVILRAETEDGDTGMSADDFIRLREHTGVFQNLSASTERAFRLDTRAGSQDITASLVTTGFFQMMDDRFYQGHDFDPIDPATGNDRFAILSHAMWEQLGADKFVVGSTIWMNKTPYTVVGVLAAGLRDRGASVTVPLILTSRQSLSHPQWVNVIGRLKNGISVLQAQSNVAAALARISRSNLNLAVVPINSGSFHNDWKFTFWLVLGLIAFLILMECVSVLSLFRLRSEAALKRDLKLFGES